MDFKLVPYADADRSRWNQFVRDSKNGTFLFQREFLEYHADRFPDASLIAEDAAGRVLALLPATRKGPLLSSHQGLTYGGFVVDSTMTCALMLELFDRAAGQLRGAGVERIFYKTIPHIYHRLPAEEDRYALFRLGAQLVRRDVLFSVDQRAERRVQERRRRGVKKAGKAGVVVERTASYSAYWQILEENLVARHGVKPAHTLAEIELLAGRFPAEIALYTARLGEQLLGGVVLFESPRVAHVQYIASTPAGRDLGALDLLFEQLLTGPYAHKTWFDFGASTQGDGLVFNAGLAEQKEGFGARTVVHDCYELRL